MILFIVALWFEATLIIENYGLEKDKEDNLFEIYKNKKYLLIISGVGMTKSIMATTYLLSKYRDIKLIINFGVCGSNFDKLKIGDVIVPNKITNINTNLSIYPEILFKHNFIEVELLTCSKIMKKSDENLIKSISIIDMEAYGFCEAASFFVNIHKIHIIKIVSDFLNIEGITPKKVIDIINLNIQNVFEYLEKVERNLSIQNIFNEIELDKIKNYSESCKFSQTMNYEFLNILKYLKVTQNEFVLENYFDYIVLNKNEGKKYLEKLRKSCVE